MRLYLREDFKALMAALAPAGTPDASTEPPSTAHEQFDDAFGTLASANGQVYRYSGRRRTFRLGAYFVKLHNGVGWWEIAKNLLALRRPVLGARNEFVACQHLRAHGVPAPAVAGFGIRGWHPARRRSFVACDALDGFASLETLAGRNDLGPLMRRRLLLATAALLRAMHAAGVHHRDCYVEHILADTTQWAAGHAALAIIDLHRARVTRALPRRWRRRDLAALLFSATAFAPNRRELLRFAHAYGGASSLRRDGRFWRGVLRRAARLRQRGRPATNTPGAASDISLPSVAEFRALGGPPAVPFRFDVDLAAGPRRMRCVAVLRWQPGRDFTVRATSDGETFALSGFLGFGRTRRLHSALHSARRLATAGAGPDALLIGRGGGARMLICAPPTGRPATAGDLPTLLAALARIHAQALRPFADADFRLCPDGVGVAHWEVGPLRPPRDRTIDRDLARLLDRFGDGAPVADAVRRYAEARGWPSGRVDEGRVRRHMLLRRATDA